MRIMAQLSAKPSAWNRQKEVVSDESAKQVLSKIKRDTPPAAEAENRSADEDDQALSAPEAEVSPPSESDGSSPVLIEDPEAGTVAKGEPVVDTGHDEGHDELHADDAENQTNALPAEDDALETHPEPAAQHRGKRQLAKRSGLKKVSSDTSRRAAREEEEQKRLAAEDEKKRLREQRLLREQIEKENREEERVRRLEDRAEQRKVREEDRQWQTKRREEGRKAIEDAAKEKGKALTLDDLAKIRAQNQFAERFSGMSEDKEKYSYDPTAPQGPSQTVIYSSKFIERLSDITDDMSISGALSIKAARIGGSGRGSFVDSDKFKDSDLKFYISVKVINQTLNFKDALVYNPMKNIQGPDFNKVYGDSFVSGFVEGGEFNALVTMKVLNKAKMTDIKAEAKVALTAGPVDITAEANVGIARSNLETNTETTIQVSWCGGGHVKPMEQPWTIESIMQAAARFPDLVADCPQRTYAILTKYDSLRSFVVRKPAAYTKLQYENAQIYTNALMDAFMTYKSTYKKLGEQIVSIQGKTLEIVPWDQVDAQAGQTEAVVSIGSASSTTVDETRRFDATLEGLSKARTAIRKQMTCIVNEVDRVEADPTLATQEDHQEPFQSPATFEARVPEIKIPGRLQHNSQPLSGKRFIAKTQTQAEFDTQANAEKDSDKANLYDAGGDGLSQSERDELDKMTSENPGLGTVLRVSAAVGLMEKGTPFNNLEFLQPDWRVTAITAEVLHGAVTYVQVEYDNGLLLRRGHVSWPLILSGMMTTLTYFSQPQEPGRSHLETFSLESVSFLPRSNVELLRRAAMALE